MTAVWYIGGAEIRIISENRWAAIGLPHAESVWDINNSWSIPSTEFSEDQLELLDRLGDFDIQAPDGPRPGGPEHLVDGSLATQVWVLAELDNFRDEFSGIIQPSVYEGVFSSFYQAHPYTFPPSVRVIDGDGEEVEPGVEHPDSSHVAIQFPAPFACTIIVG